MSRSLVLVSVLLALPAHGADDPPAASARARATDRLDARRQAEAARNEALAAEEIALLRRARAAELGARTQMRVLVSLLGGGRKSMLVEPKQADMVDPEEDDAVPAVRPAMGLNIGGMAVAGQNFDEWIFGPRVLLPDRQAYLKSLLAAKVWSSRTSHNLDEIQFQKLLVAGNGDIQRFLDRVEQRRDDFEAVRQDYRAGVAFLRELEPLTTEFQAGPFGSESLFAKTLHTMTIAPAR